MTTIVGPEVETAMTWRLLSLGLAPPTRETIAEVEALAEALVDVTGDPDVAEVLATAQARGLEATATEYERLFGGAVRVAPYEGSYEHDPIRQARQLADVSGFYRAFGASAQGLAAERPDHAGCELEFLAFLELRRLSIDAGHDLALLDEVVESFLLDHAGRWLPVFFSRVQEEAQPGSVYGPLAALGRRIMASELQQRDLAPPALRRPHGQAPVERDTFECG